MNIKKDLCELDPDEVPFYTDEDISLALADDDEDQRWKRDFQYLFHCFGF